MPGPVTLAFVADHPVETARILEQEKPEQAAAFIAQLEPDAAARTLAPMIADVAAACLLQLSPSACVEIIKQLPIHSSGALMRRFDKDRCDSLLGELPDSHSERLRRLLEYPADSVGAHAESDALAVSEDITVGNMIAHARRAPESLRKYVYVLDDQFRLTGTVDARRCFLAPRTTRIGSLAERHPVAARARASLRDTAGMPAWQRFDVLPVVDRGNTFVGALRRRKLLELIEASRQQPRTSALPDTAAELADLYWDAATAVFHGDRP